MTVKERIEDIKTNPERHHHDWLQMQTCCMTEDGIDLSIMQAHETYAAVGRNGGRACDVISGPCACGAWH